MNVQSLRAGLRSASRRNGFVDVNTGKIRRCHLRPGAWQTCLPHAKPTDREFSVLSAL
jgi:hypothetical protein